MSQTHDTVYGVIDAEGYYGDVATVWASFPTLEQARRFCTGRKSLRIVEGCHKAKGDKVTRAGLSNLLNRGDWKAMPLR